MPRQRIDSEECLYIKLVMLIRLGYRMLVIHLTREILVHVR